MGDRLEHYLSQSIKQDELGVAIKNTILSLSNAAKKISKSLAKNGLPENQLGTQVGEINSDGDTQKALDLIADENIVTALKNKNVVAYFSEEQESALLLDPEGNLIVCADPLDGSSNIDNNTSVGTIFSILPTTTPALFTGAFVLSPPILSNSAVTTYPSVTLKLVALPTLKAKNKSPKKPAVTNIPTQRSIVPLAIN